MALLNIMSDRSQLLREFRFCHNVPQEQSILGKHISYSFDLRGLQRPKVIQNDAAVLKYCRSLKRSIFRDKK